MQRIANILHFFDPHPNRTQMDSYIRYTGARCGIFVHSRSENPETWEDSSLLFDNVLLLLKGDRDSNQVTFSTSKQAR
jgi:hypothetical protein